MHLFGEDMNELSLTACAKMLGMSTTYMQVYVDREYLDMRSNDIGLIRKDMIKIMERNENSCDFGIEDMFEI